MWTIEPVLSNGSGALLEEQCGFVSRFDLRDDRGHMRWILGDEAGNSGTTKPIFRVRGTAPDGLASAGVIAPLWTCFGRDSKRKVRQIVSYGHLASH
jgi:hypothetical protein